MRKPYTTKTVMLPSQHGFTLIEMLVVLVIVGVITSVALIAMSGMNSQRKVRWLAVQLQQALLTAKQQAMLMPQTLGMKIKHDGYQFYVYCADDHGRYHWKNLTGDVLSQPTVFTRGISATWVKLGKDASRIDLDHTVTKMIMFSPSGDVTPFTLLISDPKKTAIYRLAMSNSGVLSLENITRDQQHG